jgi:hypothetical protein
MTIRIDSCPSMACPAGRIVIHNFARRAILDALAPADRLIDVGCGGGLLLEFFGADREHAEHEEGAKRVFNITTLVHELQQEGQWGCGARAGELRAGACLRHVIS